MNKVNIEPLSAVYRLLNPGCVVLVSVGDGVTDNVFPVTWNMPARKEPAKVALVSGKGHHSYPYIVRTGELGINVPEASLVDAVLGCGRCSGRDGIDKFARFGLTRRPARRIRPPLVAEAVASVECRVAQIVDLGASSLIVADVLTAEAAPEHFADGHWSFDNGLALLHHLSGDRFCVSDRVVRGRR